MKFLNQFSQKIFLIFFQKNNLICFFLILFLFFLDRIVKYKILNISENDSRIYINDFINIDLVWNTGIGFGLLSSNSNIIYNSISFIIALVIFFLIYLILKSKMVDKILFSIVLGGALGNFYDRLIFFAVPDFIDLHYQNFHWFTFNIADIFITVGILMIIIKDLFLKKYEI